MRRVVLVCLLGWAMLGLLHAQPNITSLQSSLSTSNVPQYGAAITSGTPIASFKLYINGNFSPSTFSYIEWYNEVTNLIETPNVISISPTQIVVSIPAQNQAGSFFATPTNVTQPVSIIEYEYNSGEQLVASNAGLFTLNPSLAPPSPTVLPAGAIGQPYAASIFTGGTPPYNVILLAQPLGTLPPGLPLQNSQTLSGTPTTAGLYQYTLQITDEWGNLLDPTEAIEIEAQPTISLISPNSAPAGSNDVTITVTGTNFVSPTTGLSSNYPGTLIEISSPYTVSDLQPLVRRPRGNLVTTVLNATTATATIPAAYLTVPQQLSIVAQQPSFATSNALPFTVLGPAITTISPNPVTARATPIPMTVNGSSFLAGGSGQPQRSIILSNGNVDSTTFISGTSLSTTQTFSIPNTAVAFQVENPGGSLSNSVNVIVLPAPTITSVTPVPFPGGQLTVNGANFTNTMAVLFNGTAVQTSFVSTAQLTAIVPPTLLSGTSAQVAVQTTDNYVTPPFTISLSQFVITTASLPNETANAPYSVTLAASGGLASYSWAATGLPLGLNISPSGAISGASAAVGTYTVNLTVTDSNKAFAQKSLSLTVLPDPAISTVTPNPFPGGQLTVNGANFTNTMLVLFNGTAIQTTFVSAGQLTAAVPASLMSLVSSTTALITVQTTDNYTTPPYTLNLNPVNITTASLPAETANAPYSVAVTASGGVSPYTWSATGLPLGLTISAAGAISGASASAGSFTVTLTATDSTGATARRSLPLTVLPDPAITSVTPNPFPGGRLTVSGTNFTTTMVVLFNGTALQTFSANAGQLTATPPPTLVTGATAQIAVQTVDNYVSPPYALTLSLVTISTASLPTETANAPYSVPLAASGGTSPYTWVATGLPSGMTVSAAGVITGASASAGSFTVNATVTDSNGVTASKALSLTVAPDPAITSVTPSPFPGGKLTVNGVNFTGAMTVLFNGFPVPTSFVSATQLTATVTSSLFGGSTALVAVQTSDNYTSPATKIILGTPVQITTTSIPAGTGLQPYDAKLAATGGTPPYVWTARGLPQGLSINSSTGEITGTPTSFGNFTLSVTATDVNGLTSTVQFPAPVAAPAPPPQISSATLPPGFVNVSYNYTIASQGGNGNVSFGLGSGAIPPGLNLDNTGLLKGLPTTAGSYTFSVIVTDSDGLSSSAGFTLVIKPQPLNIITPGPLASVTVGAAVNITFTAFGGVPPYTFSATGTLPPGTSMAANGTLSGTTTTPGTYAFTVTVNDSAQSQPPGTKSYSITVNPLSLTVTGTFGNGQVGVAYSAQAGGAGGAPPYTLSVSGLPPGVTFANGAVGGTPTTAGQYTVSVTVTDSAKTTATQTFPVSIAASALTITTGALPNGTVNVAYSATLSATGGSGQYSWTVSGLPPGVTATAAGAISGTPTTAGSYSVTATVTDTAIAVAVITASKTFAITVAVPPLSVTTASLANATVGTGYSATLGATGGVPPYTWTATGLPAGLSVSSTGAISGTATAAGAASVSVTVKDSLGTTASSTLQLTVVLPTAPTLSITGLPTTSAPATQSTITIGIAAPYPVAVTVNLTLTFAAVSGPDDPTVQFSTGGRTAQLTIPAGATAALTTVGVQTGTVAGTATITAQLLAGTVNITPTPAPTSTVKINSVPPVISSVTATSNSTGFTVTVIGFATSRVMTSALFTFAPASGVNLQTTSVTITAGTLFATWYSSSAATPFGSQFSFAQPFTVTGATGAVSSVTVTLTNPDGSSTPVSAAVH